MRAPHAWLKDGRSTLDLFGRGFTLLCFGDAIAVQPFVAAARARELALQVAMIDEPAIAAFYERSFVLVRPDGHVAWRGEDTKEAGAILDRVRGY
jgi:hypothetical protein